MNKLVKLKLLAQISVGTLFLNSAAYASDANIKLKIDAIGDPVLTPIQISVPFFLKDTNDGSIAGMMTLGCNAAKEQISIGIHLNKKYSIFTNISNKSNIYFSTGGNYPPYLSALTSKSEINTASMIGMRSSGHPINSPGSVAAVMDIISDSKSFDVFTSGRDPKNHSDMIEIAKSAIDSEASTTSNIFRQVTDTCKKMFGIQF